MQTIVMSGLLFVALILIIVAIYLAYHLRGKSWREYFNTQNGKGILKGIVIAPAAIIILGVLIALLPNYANANNGTFFNDAGVFIGIDKTRKRSPQCEANNIDEKGTSNLGVYLNVWQSTDRLLRVNSHYLHHSCVLGPDDIAYDALGIQLIWTPWRRQ